MSIPIMKWPVRVALRSALSAALILGASAAIAQERPRIAVVNLDAIVARSAGGKAIQAQIQKLREQAEAQSATLTRELESLEKRYMEGRTTLSPDEVSSLQRQYEDKGRALQRFQRDKQAEAEKLNREGIKQIEKELEPIFKQVLDEEGYDVILNYVPGVLVMAAERVDITERVVARLGAK